MRISVVPAQITTVEDKIAGNISVQQATFLGVPVLVGFIAVLALPPSGELVAYKIVFVGIIFVLSAALAVRVEDRIIAQWLVLLARYLGRPRYFVYDKNTSYLRADKPQEKLNTENHKDIAVKKKAPTQGLKMAQYEVARLERFARDSRAGLRFEVGKKGKLHVRVTEAN